MCPLPCWPARPVGEVCMPENTLSLALLEVNNLTPALLAADACAKSAGVRLLGIESSDGAAQCIKLVGTVAEVLHAAEAGKAAAERM